MICKMLINTYKNRISIRTIKLHLNAKYSEYENLFIDKYILIEFTDNCCKI